MKEPEHFVIDLQLRSWALSDKPTSAVEVPLGGPNPMVVVAIRMDPADDKGEVQFHVQMETSGFRDTEMMIEVMRELLNHMETTPYNSIEADGVTRHEPMK